MTDQKTPLDAVAFYRGFLLSTGIRENTVEGSAGFLPMGEDNTPFTINEKLLVLPTKDILAKFNELNDVIVFHPTCENVLRKDSAVFNFIKRLVKTSLTADIMKLANTIITVAHEPSLQSKLTKKQRDVLTHFCDIDDKTIENLDKIFSRIHPLKENKLIDFTVSRGAKSESGEKFNRLCYIHLNILSELTKLENKEIDKLYGIQLRKKDVAVYKALFQYIYGVTDGVIRLEHGTNATVAPNFKCIVEAYLLMKEQLIDVYHHWKKMIPSISSDDLSWAAGLENLNQYRIAIPAMPGNEGEESVNDGKERKTLSADIVKPARQRPTYTTSPTVQKSAPPPKIDETAINEPLSYDDIIRLRNEKSVNNNRQRYNSYQQGYNPARPRAGYNYTDLSDVDEDYRQRMQANYPQQGYNYSQPMNYQPRPYSAPAQPRSREELRNSYNNGYRRY